MAKAICVVIAALVVSSSLSAQNQLPSELFHRRLAELEQVSGGRIGVAVLDTAGGKLYDYRAEERFAICSTFKLLLAAAVLSRVDSKEESLDRFVSFGSADMDDYAPVARKHLSEGQMSIFDLCAAAVEYSDNTAANLLLRSLGGPHRLTGYVRSLGDTVTRLDRYEPDLNSNLPGDERDTTSPAVMRNTMAKLLLGDALSPESRQSLISWLVENKTGTSRLRAGMPTGWRVGDKTGGGGRGATNDIAIVWPSGRPPLLIAVYSSDSARPATVRDA